MNEVKIFESPQFGAIRTAGTSEQPMFCLSDVCKVLELQPGRVKQRLNPKGITLSNTLTEGGEQQMVFINEQNLYKVIMRSDKPQAEAFQDWVCGEVLPSIRKSGGYIAAAPEETPEQIMAKALRVADETLKRQQEQLNQLQERNAEQQVLIQAKDEQIEKQTEDIKHLTPIAEYTKEVLQSTTDYTLTQVAKDLGFRSVYTFTDWLTDNNIMYRQSGQWMPSAQYSGFGYFRTRTCKYVKSDDTIGTSITTVITEKGRAMLHIIADKKGGVR